MLFPKKPQCLRGFHSDLSSLYHLHLMSYSIETNKKELIKSPFNTYLDNFPIYMFNKPDFTRVLVIYTSRQRNGLVERFRKERFH